MRKNGEKVLKNIIINELIFNLFILIFMFAISGVFYYNPFVTGIIISINKHIFKRNKSKKDSTDETP